MNTKKLIYASLIIVSSFVLVACGPKKNVTFSNDSPATDGITPLVDKDAKAKITITKTVKLGEAFKVDCKSVNPDGTGTVQAKARSLKEIPLAGKSGPGEGKKLILVEMSVMGNAKNKGDPSTFNQIGNSPSPQFVMIDQATNTSTVETTYFSDSYTVDKNLFELSKITTDHEQWVDTALVFEVDKGYNPSLAFRFTNPQGQTEFYGITTTTK